MKPLLAVALAALGILGLAGCATRDTTQSSVPVQQEQTPSGDKLVSVQPYRLSCTLGQNQVQSTYQCPVIGAQWSSARAGIGNLVIGVPDTKGQEVTGADFHLGNEVIRVRSKAATQPQGLNYPATSFDVPLTFVERLAYSPRTWARIYIGERYIDANVRAGDEIAKAAEALAYFMRSVDETSGRTPSDLAREGGILDRLGIGGGDGSSSSGKGVEGMHPR